MRQRPAIALAAQAILAAVLTGAAQVSPGDEDGSGAAKLAIDLARRELCYELTVSAIAAATAAHIHQAAAGEIGPPIVTLAPPDADGAASGCVHLSRQLLQGLLDEPAAYYVNVHNAEFPGGALRGQLRGDRLSEGA